MSFHTLCDFYNAATKTTKSLKTTFNKTQISKKMFKICIPGILTNFGTMDHNSSKLGAGFSI